jgi:hypothetical protein
MDAIQPTSDKMMEFISITAALIELFKFFCHLGLLHCRAYLSEAGSSLLTSQLHIIVKKED